ncbi:universal stress protein [Sphingomonas piscis]|uniref:Universal stress protein n=1 Tax=Sphingomonas piscis TaxID=2714943 RepID=A0A6G7YPK8_9SPHN|nr:universal stress protein [Sphingomonas piscis]QIK78674.1 universal stress protein [Sphingomonas piscis]
MLGDTQMLIDRPAAAQSARQPAVKCILLHVQDDTSLEERFETALSLARASSGHLRCLHVTPIEAYVAFDTFGGIFVMDDVIDALGDAEKQLRARVEEKLRGEDVTWDYVEITGNVVAQILKHASLADIVITGREPHRTDFAGPAIGILGDLLQRSRTPLLIPSSKGSPFDPTGPALIAWDGSSEAADAVRSSLKLLQGASEVRVLRVDQERSEAFPGTQLLEYLSRHGIHAELTVNTNSSGGGDDYVAGCIMSQAQRMGAYLVMGGYSHTRIGEFLFGGVTRTVLQDCQVPLVIAH